MSDTQKYKEVLYTSGAKKNITGIAIQEPFQQKITLSLSLVQNASKIAFVFDNSIASVYQMETLNNLIKNGLINSNNLTVEIYKTTTFNDFQNIITTLQGK